MVPSSYMEKEETLPGPRLRGQPPLECYQVACKPAAQNGPSLYCIHFINLGKLAPRLKGTKKYNLCIWKVLELECLGIGNEYYRLPEAQMPGTDLPKSGRG